MITIGTVIYIPIFGIFAMILRQQYQLKFQDQYGLMEDNKKMKGWMNKRKLKNNKKETKQINQRNKLRIRKRFNNKIKLNRLMT